MTISQATGAPPRRPGTGTASARPRQRRVLWLERGQRRGRPRARELAAERLQRRGAGAALARVAGQLAAGRVLNDRRAADRRRQRAEDGLQPAPLDHQPLEALVHLGAALQHRVLLVDQQREGALGDRDERHLVRHLEQRHAPLLRLIDQRLGHPLVLEPGAETQPGDVVVGEQGHEAALPGRAAELDPGGQQQLAAGEPWRRVLELRDVDPADRPLGAVGPGDQLEAAVGDEIADRQHRVSATASIGAVWPSCSPS